MAETVGLKLGRALIRLGCWLSGLQPVAYFPWREPTSSGGSDQRFTFTFPGVSR